MCQHFDKIQTLDKLQKKYQKKTRIGETTDKKIQRECDWEYTIHDLQYTQTGINQNCYERSKKYESN